MKVHYSSNSNEWATPNYVFNKLKTRFNFTLDPCCTKETARCKKFYTIKEDGLIQDWSKDITFCNPPYGRKIGLWVKKAYEESQKGGIVVMLIPARTDTKYFEKYCTKASQIIFISGRIKFVQGNNKPAPAPFPSCIVVFKIGTHNPDITWERF